MPALAHLFVTFLLVIACTAATPAVADDRGETAARPLAPLADFNEAAAREEVLDLYRAVDNPLNAQQRHDYVRKLVLSFDDLANTLAWPTIGELLDEQQEQRGGQPVFDLVRCWWHLRDRRVDGRVDADENDSDPNSVAALRKRIEELARTPRFAWPHFLLASLALQEREMDKALEYVNRAMQLNPEFLEARRLKTATMISLAAPEFKRFSREQVMASLDASLRMQPDDIGPELQLLAALRELDRVRLLRDNAASAVTRAQAEYLLGYHTPKEQVATAREHFEAAIKEAQVEPTTLRQSRYVRAVQAQAQYQLAASLFAAEPKDRDRAFDLLLAVRSFDDENGLAISLLVQMVAVARDAGRALQAIDWMLELQKKTAPRVDLFNWLGGMVRVVDVAGRFDEVPVTRVWIQVAADLQAVDGMSDSEEQFVLDLLRAMIDTRDDRRSGLPTPLAVERLGGEDALAAVSVVVDWLRARTDHEEFRIRLPATDLLGLVVGASGVKSDEFAGIGRAVMSQDAGTADDRKSAWARALAIHGQSLRARKATDADAVIAANARAIFGAMEAAVKSGELVNCRQIFDNCHRALRALTGQSLRSDFRSRHATMTDFENLLTAWRDRLP